MVVAVVVVILSVGEAQKFKAGGRSASQCDSHLSQGHSNLHRRDRIRPSISSRASDMDNKRATDQTEIGLAAKFPIARYPCSSWGNGEGKFDLSQRSQGHTDKGCFDDE